MKIIPLFGIAFTLFSIILGAFGAHFLKKIIPETALQSFEVGVRYMIYHGLALLVLYLMPIEDKKWTAMFFIIGTLSFSVSIFILSLQSIKRNKIKWIGFITPIGGVLLIIGWILFLLRVIVY
tara:strand:- start:63 stop:431 length:369 start_codon:yes stop_codon:yes gene_type:complete